jgi:hypothetical protein
LRNSKAIENVKPIEGKRSELPLHIENFNLQYGKGLKLPLILGRRDVEKTQRNKHLL